MMPTNTPSSIIRNMLNLNPDECKGLSPDADYILTGYGHEYRGRRYGGMIAEDIYRITKYEGNIPADFQHMAARYLFSVPTVWNVKIIRAASGSENFDTRIIDASNERGFVLPISLFHTDVLPEIDQEDELALRVFCIPSTLTAHEAEVGADEEVLGGNLAVPAEAFGDIAWEERKDKVFFTGKILSVNEQKISCPAAPLLILTMETAGAPLTLICSPRIISAEQRELLVPGNRIRVMGWLYGDAAAAEYSSGIVFDLEHNLRLFHSCVRASDFGRATQIFAIKNKYVRRGELVATGPEETMAFLNKVAEQIKSDGLQPDIGFGQIVLMEKGGILEAREKCLVYFTTTGSVHNIICGKVDETGRLSLLCSRYEYEGIGKMAVSHSVAVWHEPLDALESGTEEEETSLISPGVGEQGHEDESWFADPSVAERVHGDRETFYGEPLFGFGDVLEDFLPKDENHIIEEVDTFVRHGKFAGDYTLRNGDFQGAYFDYPDRDFAPGIQIAVGKERDDQGYELKYLYPLLKGRDYKLKVSARFDWPDNICGMVAASWKNSSIRNYFVPSYGLCSELAQPGEEIPFSVSGVAINVDRVAPQKFTVTTGQMYEMILARFLAAHPDKTIADFAPPVVDTSNAVMSFPTATTCFFDTQSPLLQMERLTFQNRKFVKMLLTLDRHMETEEEMQTWIYASEEKIRSLDLHPGELLQCTIWFCASVI